MKFQLHTQLLNQLFNQLQPLQKLLPLLALLLSYNAYAIDMPTFENNNAKIKNYDYLVHGKTEMRQEGCVISANRKQIFDYGVPVSLDNGYTAEECTNLASTVEATDASLYCEAQAEAALLEFGSFPVLTDEAAELQDDINQLAAKTFVRCMKMDRLAQKAQQLNLEVDGDSDGILDELDDCPDQADEWGNGVDENGCAIEDKFSWSEEKKEFEV